MHRITRSSTTVELGVDCVPGVTVRQDKGRGPTSRVFFTFVGESVDAGIACLRTTIDELRSELQSLELEQAAAELNIELLS